MDAVTDANDNIAMGRVSAGALTTGYTNIALGYNAMGGGVTTGKCNIALGFASMDALTTGLNNVALGMNSLTESTTGCDNVAIGTLAMECGITTGYGNVAIGYRPGQRITSGCCNTIVGFAAGQDITTGHCNTIIGRDAGYGVTSGCGNIALGSVAGASGFSITTHNFRMVLGNTGITCFQTQVARSAFSDCRDKTDVSDLDLGLNYIKALRPVYYRWDQRLWYDDFADDRIKTDEDKNLYINYKTDGSKKKQRWNLGLLAQEALVAEKANTSKEQVMNDDDGCPEDWCDEGLLVSGTNEEGYQMTYESLIMPLIKAVQELSAKVEALENA